MKLTRIIFTVLALALGSNGWGQSVFTKYGPVAGIQKSTGATYQNTAAASSDVIGLWSGCTGSNFLRGDGTCQTPAGTGVTSVSQTVPAGFAVTGSPVTGSGTLAIAYATGQTANRVLATPDGTTGALSLRALVAGDIPPINLGSTANGGVSSATILLGTNGGTSNGFFSVTGPTTALRTFTFPNASATVLTSNAAVTVPQGGTGVATLTSHGVLLGEGTSNVSTVAAMAADTLLQGQGVGADPAAVTVNNCGSSTQALSYNTTTHAFGCQTISTGGTGTVTNVASGTGLTGGPITTTGTLSVDQSFSPTWTGTHTWSAQGAINQTGSFAGVNYASVANTSTNAAAAAGVSLANSAISGVLRETSTAFSGPGGASALQLINSGSNPISLATNSTERVQIAGAGNVTVNGTASGTPLSVGDTTTGQVTGSFGTTSGSTNTVLVNTSSTGVPVVQVNANGVQAVVLLANASAGTVQGIAPAHDGIGTVTAARVFDIAKGGTVVMSFSASGVPSLPTMANQNVAALGTVCLFSGGQLAYNNSGTCLSSSRRFKNDILPLDSGLVEVMRLNPVSYEYKAPYGPKGRQVGLIAEDVYKLDPRLAPLDKDGLPYQVEYQQLTAVLVKGMQQQQHEIEALGAAVAALMLWCAVLIVRGSRRV